MSRSSRRRSTRSTPTRRGTASTCSGYGPNTQRRCGACPKRRSTQRCPASSRRSNNCLPINAPGSRPASRPGELRGRGEAGGLVAAITSAFQATLKPDLAEYVAWQESNVDERWGRSRRFGLNVAFESLLFGMLVVVALWPWVRREARPWRWALHLGSVPALLFAPYLLGYAVWVFTTAGVSGGVLYPAIVRLAGTPITWIWTPIDGPILDALPQPFEWLSQTPGPAGSLSGGGVGPTAVVFLSMAVAAASWAAARASLGVRGGTASVTAAAPAGDPPAAEPTLGR